MGMSVVPEQAGWMIARNLNRVVQNLARHGQHSEHVILRGVWRDSEPMKMQVRHIHAGIHRTRLRGLGRKIVDVRDSENVAWGSTDHWSHGRTIESEGISPILIHRVQRKGYNVILRSNLRRLRQRNGLGAAQSCEKYLRTNDQEDQRALSGLLIHHWQSYRDETVEPAFVLELEAHDVYPSRASTMSGAYQSVRRNASRSLVAYTLIRSCNGGSRRSDADIFLRIIQALRCTGINPVD